MTLSDILRSKGSQVYSISAQSTLEDVVQSLVRHNCGSLVVCEGDDCQHGRLLGIITERDILRACAAHEASLAELRVADLMTRELVVGSPDDSIDDTMGLLTDKRIRHLPVVQNNRLLGLISIGDVVKWQHDSLSLENHYLKSYIHG